MKPDKLVLAMRNGKMMIAVSDLSYLCSVFGLMPSRFDSLDEGYGKNPGYAKYITFTCQVYDMSNCNVPSTEQTLLLK
jgi:hypothetical protein